MLKSFFTWIEDAEKEIFACWVCKKFPGEANEKNKDIKGCIMFHRNYLIQHQNDQGEKVCINWKNFGS